MKKYIINKIWEDKEIHTEKLDECSTKKEAYKLYKKHLEREKTDENSIIKNLLDDENDTVTDGKEWFLVVSRTNQPKRAMIEIKEVYNG